MDFLKKRTFIGNLIRQFITEWGDIMTRVRDKQVEESDEATSFSYYSYAGADADTTLVG